MPTDFELLLQKLHPNSTGEAQGAELNDDESTTPIVINAKRQFVVPEDYNLVLAYEGDVNSQIVTFKLPLFHEKHNLSLCNCKTLRWKNTSSNVEDWSELNVIDIQTDYFIVEWIVPPAAFAKAGMIEIAISIYDLITIDQTNKTKQLAFSWNTPTFSGFVVGGTLSDVGEAPNIPVIIAPAKNEILFIHEETQSIVAPAGYNYNITTYGNINTDVIYFQTTKTIGGIELTKPGNKIVISVIVSMGDFTGSFEIPESDIVSSFADDSTGSGLLSFVWRIPEKISYNKSNYTGALSIAVSFQRFELGTPLNSSDPTPQLIEKECWRTIPFHNLTIRRSLVYNSSQVIPTDFCNVIEGDSDQLDLTARKVPGIVSLRSVTEADLEKTEQNNKQIFKNELVIVRNNNGDITNIAIGQNNGLLSDNNITTKEIFISLLQNLEFIIDAN